MSRVWLVVVTLAGVVTAGICADEQRGEKRPRSSTAESELRERVHQLVAQLDAGSRAARTQAEQELLQLGPEVLPHLPASELLPNVSVREAVRRVRLALERRKAQESLQPSRVTLNGELRVDEIARRIAEQTGNRIELENVPRAALDRTLDVNYENTDFWPAIDGLCERAGLDMRTATNAVALLPGDADESEPVRVSYTGPFRIAVLSAETRAVPGDADQQLLRCRLRVIIEPRLRALFLKFAAEDVAASVAQMGMLQPFSPDARYELPMGQGGGQIDVQLDYRLPSGIDATAVSLQGRMEMLVAAGEEQVEFENLSHAAGIAKRRGGVTVELEEAQFEKTARGARTARVAVTVAYDIGGPAFESHRNWIYQNRAWLQSPEGRRIEPGPDVTTRQQADGAVVLVYEFEGLEHEPGEYRFAYVAPTLLAHAPVEIDLTKLPVQSGPQP